MNSEFFKTLRCPEQYLAIGHLFSYCVITLCTFHCEFLLANRSLHTKERGVMEDIFQLPSAPPRMGLGSQAARRQLFRGT